MKARTSRKEMGLGAQNSSFRTRDLNPQILTDSSLQVGCQHTHSQFHAGGEMRAILS